MEIDIQKEFGSTLDKIWSDFTRACAGTSINTSLPPAIVSHIEKNCDVLFIGMNPSVVAAQQQPKYYCPCTITIDYFKQLSKFCKEISLNSWGYLDMYPIRHTKQSDVVDISTKIRQRDSFWDGLEKLSKAIICEVNPKLIVVLNAAARDVFCRIYGLTTASVCYNNVDPVTGCFMVPICIERNKQIPVIFSGMLSGQRALDVGSRVSLQWHIDKVLHPKHFRP